MNLLVLMKQVPASQEIITDPQTGNLVRGNSPSRTNPYDLYALEAALQIKDSFGGLVTVITMGPAAAKNVLIEAYSMGADSGVLLSDPAFAGADVYATSYTISKAIEILPPFDLIFCGRQSTDGDTAQTGPALAAQLKIPILNWVTEIVKTDASSITVKQLLENQILTLECSFPCIICVETSIGIPRVPSLSLKLSSRKKQIRYMTLDNFCKNDYMHFGTMGSPTAVTEIFTPSSPKRGILISESADVLAQKLMNMITAYTGYGEKNHEN